MRLYIDPETNTLVSDPAFKSPLGLATFKRGDAARVSISFIGETANPDRQIIFGIKQTGDYDGEFLVTSDSYAIDVDDYVMTPSFNTVALNDALNHDGTAGNDVASVAAILEITWSDDDGTTWLSTNTVTATVFNDVCKNVEGSPIQNPSPVEWLDVRAVRHDEAQSLSEASKAQARENIDSAVAPLFLANPPVDPVAGVAASQTWTFYGDASTNTTYSLDGYGFQFGYYPSPDPSTVCPLILVDLEAQAEAFALWVNTWLDTVTAIASGAVVTLTRTIVGTAGNNFYLTGGFGVSLGGPTLAGGLDAIAGNPATAIGQLARVGEENPFGPDGPFEWYRAITINPTTWKKVVGVPEVMAAIAEDPDLVKEAFLLENVDNTSDAQKVASGPIKSGFDQVWLELDDKASLSNDNTFIQAPMFNSGIQMAGSASGFAKVSVEDEFFAIDYLVEPFGDSTGKKFTIDHSGNFTASIGSHALTANRSWLFPNAAGTIALTSSADGVPDNFAATISGAKTFSGQLELTGQAATNPTSAITRDILGKEQLFNLVNSHPLFPTTYNSSGTGAAASIADNNGFNIASGTVADSWGRTGITRIMTNNPGMTGGGTRCHTPLAFGIAGFVYLPADANTEVRLICGDSGSGTPPTIGANCIAGRGFGVRFYYSAGNARREAKLFAHDGTNYVESAAAEVFMSGVGTYVNLILTTDAAGTIKLFYDSAGYDGDTPKRSLSTPLLTLSGGPTTNNYYAGHFFSAIALNGAVAPVAGSLMRAPMSWIHKGVIY